MAQFSLSPRQDKRTPPASPSRIGVDVARATGVGGRRLSWTKSPTPMKRRSSVGVRSLGLPDKGVNDEMTEERKERLFSLWSGHSSHDHLKLGIWPTLLHEIEKKEASFAVPNPIRSKGPVQIRFSAQLAPLQHGSTERSVCVTDRSLCLLQRTEFSVDTARTCNQQLLYCFQLADLATIIESQDMSTICLDFRPLDDTGGRRTILRTLPDPMYVLFYLKDQTKKDSPKAGSSFELGMSRFYSSRSMHTARNSLKDEFIAHLYFSVNPSDPAAPRALLIHVPFLLRTGDDAQRAVSRAVVKDASHQIRGVSNMVEIMECNHADTLSIAQKVAVVQVLRSEGDTKILCSYKIKALKRSGGVKTDVNAIIITDRALYYVLHSEQHFKVNRRVELQDISGLILEDNTRKDEAKQEWDVLVKVHLAKDQSKDYPSDMLFRCNTEVDRGIITGLIKQAYEELVIDKLPEHTHTNIKWGKRGKLEAWVHALRGNTLKRQLYDKRIEEALNWQLYMLRNHLKEFVALLSHVVPHGDLKFVGKSLVTLCQSGGLIRELLHFAIEVEMSTNHINTVFRGQTLPSSILRAYVGNAMDEYLRLVLAPILPKLLEKNPNLEVGPGRPPLALCEWCDRFFDRITDQEIRADMPHEMLGVIQLISYSSESRGLDPRPFIGGYIMLRVFCPAITSPEHHGLLKPGFTVGPKGLRNLLLVGKILQHLANGTHLRGDVNLERSMNWWIDYRYGGRSVDPPPDWYRNVKERKVEIEESRTWGSYLESILLQGTSWSEVPETMKERTEDLAADVDRLESIQAGFKPLDLEDPTTPILFSMHRVLSNYVENMLCLLWTDTGVLKQELVDLEGQRDADSSEQSSDPDVAAPQPFPLPQPVS
eukprot:Sspe_Gene.16868::Locus_5963_Transcript_1_1_Confidence_1.000_Length_2727::g.16868::m.16868